MQVTKPVGRNASALKYDILSALGVSALSGDKHRQRLVLRLIVLITTRYNWQNNELSIGRAEMARLWSVNERTVKREIAKMRTAGWLEVKRAGVKGRVTVYALNIADLMRGTANVWAVIGSDFEDRMQERHGGAQDGAGQGDATDPNVILFQPRSRSTSAEGTWGRVLAQLHAEVPAQAATWFGQLSEMAHEGERVTLLAPSRFIANYVRGHFMSRILRGYVAIDPSIRQIEVVAAEE
ncbi:DnaA N-terminal domain-containing protein [Sedimentitalea todarodis]|uniref:DnaA N-terminal domain-containing protein n=1 Tax=Sedimentitalea todarodis TaxID=1631240 RepID=A0ABU3VL20_9RHOB|nr:DnaA N-terminal domain-containing protein [Sedimentitalea todarodis]MDU9006891.1 DnaA N-terminal domain-containing protein [Sedimentitalea todarodis]